MKVRGGQSPPFRRPTEAVEASPWTTSSGLPLGRLLPDWDPATEIEFRRTLAVDPEGFIRTSDLADPSILRMGVTWQSSATRLRGASEPVEERVNEASEVLLRVRVPGRLAGGVIALRTQVTLAEGVPTSSLAATHPGEILWEEKARLVLEGDAGRFPVNVVDFSTVAELDDEAAWTLHWPTADYSEPFGASLRLLVNSANEEVVAAVTADEPSELGRWIRRQVRFETARALVQRALADASFLDGVEVFDEQSVGRVVHEMMSLAWGPLVEPSALASRMREDPSRFESELQGRFLAEA